MEKLTVFILLSGDECLDRCMEAIESQIIKSEVELEVKILKNLSPMSFAFNEMHRQCDTEFFIQVDSDIVLKPHAIEKLYGEIKTKSFFTYAVAGQLYEEGFGVGGAVRCWRKSFFRFFKFRDRRTVDRDLHNRCKWFGFRRHYIKEILGTHFPRHSCFTNYLKTKSDVEKWRFLGRSPEVYMLPLYRQLLKSYNTEAVRLFGLFLGNLTGLERVNRSKDIVFESERLDQMKTSFALNLDKISYNPAENLEELLSNCYLGDLSKKYDLIKKITILFNLPIQDIDKFYEIVEK